MNVNLDHLRGQRDILEIQLQQRKEARGDKPPSRSEVKAMEHLKAVNDRIHHLEGEEQRSGIMPGGAVDQLQRRINSGGGSPRMGDYAQK